MGTFQGHALPGLFFITFSLWWIVMITRRLYICNTYSLPYPATATFRWMHRKYLNTSVEGIVKVVACSVGMVLEILASFDYGRHSYPVWIGDLQHVTMYFFFFLSGVVDVMKTKSRILPQNTDYVFFAISFLIEGHLFSFHLHGRSDLDTSVHHVLLYVIWMCVVAICLEALYPTSSTAAYFRSYCVLLQGVLFIQVGFILYNPFTGPWDNTKDNTMIAVCLMLWQLLGTMVMLLIVVVGTLYHMMYGRQKILKDRDLEYLQVVKLNEARSEQRHIELQQLSQQIYGTETDTDSDTLESDI